MDYDDYDEGGGNDNYFGVDVNAYGRTGRGTGMMKTVVGDGKMADIQRMVDMSNPEEKFKIILDAVARMMIESYNIQLSEANLDEILTRVSSVRKIQHKNPTAFVLGYIATRGGKNMKNVRNTIENILPLLEDSSITGPDVVRYSNLWMSIA